MELLTQLLNALWAQDFETLANPSMIGMLYFVLFMILFLENGLLPAAFLPGDSLLVLVGVLCAKGAMAFPQTVLLLTIAASLGCWVSYIQGRWLGNTRIVQNWLSHLPAHYHQRAHHLVHKHGLSALLMGRFIAFVRTLLPTIAGTVPAPGQRLPGCAFTPRCHASVERCPLELPALEGGDHLARCWNPAA